MAKLGFYDIKTIECLTREYDVRKVGYRAIPDYDNVKPEVVQSKNENKSKREKKAFEKESLVVQPIVEMKGHTGYLTFAIKF